MTVASVRRAIRKASKPKKNDVTCSWIVAADFLLEFHGGPRDRTSVRFMYAPDYWYIAEGGGRYVRFDDAERGLGTRYFWREAT